jgi:Ser/Thr protein kinase RdoA (MazF antagonist)
MTPRQVEACLDLWAETAGGIATLVNLSENHTFRIEAPHGRFFLRVHRPGYQSAVAIESELAWLKALRAETTLPVPRPLVGRNGCVLQHLPVGEADHRHGVLFAAAPGQQPTPSDDLSALFEALGRYVAVAHRQVENFVRPQDFVRPRWDAAAILDPDGLWGDWRTAPRIEGGVATILERLDAALRADLAAYGDEPDRFGLIHADMRLANLLVDGDRVTLIDFDDCGFGWFMYDFAAALSFHEDDSRAADWRARWLAGYQVVRPLRPADRAILDCMVLLRRMALLAWIGSHRETELAQAHAEQFAGGTVALAERYLERRQTSAVSRLSPDASRL